MILPSVNIIEFLKGNLEFEKYLDFLNNTDRYVLCRFRTGNHQLLNETGRWENIERT